MWQKSVGLPRIVHVPKHGTVLKEGMVSHPFFEIVAHDAESVLFLLDLGGEALALLLVS